MTFSKDRLLIKNLHPLNGYTARKTDKKDFQAKSGMKPLKTTCGNKQLQRVTVRTTHLISPLISSVAAVGNIGHVKASLRAPTVSVFPPI